MSVTTYLGTSSQIWYWSLHVTVLGGPSDFYIYICMVLDVAVGVVVTSCDITVGVHLTYIYAWY